MVDVEEFVKDFFLRHDTLYDPVKAHEYYLKTRDLKGKPKASDLKTQTQKEGFAFVQDQVKKNQKAALDKTAVAQQAAIAQLQAKAQAKRQEISDRIKQIFANVADGANQARDKLATDTQAKIDALPPIPKGLSKDQTAALQAKRSEDIAKIKGDAKAESDKISKGSAKTKADTSALAGLGKAQIASDLKGSIDKARKNYQSLKAAVVAKSQADLSKEFDNLKNNVK